jgi:hypothetical protein
LKALISAAVDLCLLKTGPQHIPASSTLFALLVLFNLMIGISLAMAAQFGFALALLQTIFELLLLLLTLYVALKLTHKLIRFNQTGTALLLSGLLLNLLALPLVTWNQRTDSAESGLLVLILFFWSIVVTAHIIRHAFEVDLNISIAVVVLYTLMVVNVTAFLFPGSV